MRIKLLFILTGMLLAEFGYYLYKRYSFEPRHVSRHEVRHKNKVFRIGIIGDSWASGTTLDTIISDEFLKHGLKTEIISFGEPEAKTKQIYDNLYASPGAPYSSSQILHHNLDYCIVLAGTSDAAGEMGAKFYAYYCSLIIGDLLKNNIIQDTIGSEPVLLVLENDTSSFHAFSRNLHGQTLSFMLDKPLNQMSDTNTHSIWNLNGYCISGSFKDSQLKTLPAYQEFWHSWKQFHPKTTKFTL